MTNEILIAIAVLMGFAVFVGALILVVRRIVRSFAHLDLPVPKPGIEDDDDGHPHEYENGFKKLSVPGDVAHGRYIGSGVL